MLSTMRRFLSRATGMSGPLALRRWEAAKTSRLNSAHWADARGEKLNDAISLDGATLVTRCVHERDNNGYVAGVIHSHKTDVVGDTGPALQVQSDDDKYNAAFEQVWAEWWQRPDINGQLSGVDLINMLVGLRWTHGEMLWQLVDAAAVGDEGRMPISLRVHDVNPRRLVDPFFGVSNKTTLGIEHDKFGRPLAYHIAEDDDFVLTPTRVPAGNVIHDFERLEPGQMRGIPFLAPVLQVVADLRDYDVQVLDAARAAADYCVLLTTNHPDAPFLEVNESTPVKRRSITMAPPGWDAKQLDPKQPTVTYVEYRRERLREIGRPVGMPLLVVQSDASGHNYSSARFDSQTYHRGNRALQARASRGPLARLVDAVAREAELRTLTPPRPKRLRHVWTWPSPPHVDPTKESKAATERLTNGTSTVTKELAAVGDELETHLETLKKEVGLYRAAGLRHPADAAAASNADGRGDDPSAARSLRRELEDLREEVEEVRESVHEVTVERSYA